MGILSGIFSAIFAAGRNGRTPSLINANTQGGLQIACLIVSTGFALLFGLITGLILKYLNQPSFINNKDTNLWIIDN
jgi:hypothetical protein